MLEAEFCTLEIPDGWMRRGPLCFAAGMEAEALVAEVEEVWEEGKKIPVPRHLEERREFLSRCFEAFEVISEGPVSAGEANASGLTVRFENDDFQPIVQREVVLSEGPVRCSLRLAGPEDEPNREALFERMVRSFRLTLGRSLAQAETFSFFSKPDAFSVNVEQSISEPFPILCHHLSLPAGWVSRVEEHTAVIEGMGKEVRIHRLLAAERNPGHWMVRRLDEMRSAQSRLLGWSQGQTPFGAFSALWTEVGGGTWRSAATQRQFSLRLAASEPLEFVIRGSFRSPAEIETFLGPLIAGLEPLDPEDWHTQPLEPWMDLTLEGPWTSTHTGLYIHPELFIPVLELRRQDEAPPLDTLRPSLHEALRQGAGVLPGSDAEHTELGQFRGCEAWRYRADAQLNIRGIWIVKGSTLYTCLLQMRDAESADVLFAKVLEGLRLPEDTRGR